MNHSCLATLNKDSIELSPEVLTPLGIRHGTRLWGMYYPRPNYGEQFGNVDILHDFMVTPIPYPVWPYAARIKLRILLHKTDLIFNELADLLRKEGVQLLLLECSRSAHRYATLTMTVAFGKLLKPIACFEGRRGVLESHASGTISSTNALVDRLRYEFTEHLFIDQHMETLATAVEGNRLEALAYFFLETQVSKVGIKREIKHRVFELVCNSGYLHLDHTGQEILGAAIGDIFPTRGFAEMESRDVNIRIAAIEPKQLTQFASLRVAYEWHPRTSGEEGRRKILADIMRPLNKKHRIWRLVNHYQASSEISEKATFEGVLQCASATSAKHWEDLRKSFEIFRDEDDALRITHASVNSFSFFRVFLSLRSDPRYHDLIKCCYEVGERFGMLKDDFRIVRNNIVPVTQTVAEQIRSSNAMLQYYGTSSHTEASYEWLSAELLAAEVCQIPVVIIKEKGIPRLDIKAIGGQAAIEVPNNPGTDDLRKAIEDALTQLTAAVLSRQR